MRISRVRVQRQRAGRARYVDNAGCRRFAKQRKLRLRDGDNAQHVRFEHRTDVIKGRYVCATRFHDLLERPSRLARVRDGRVVDKHVETTELLPDALCCGSDGGLIRDVEPDGASIRSNALRGRLPLLRLRDPMSTVKPCAARSFEI
jgi:hypothetical protein